MHTLPLSRTTSALALLAPLLGLVTVAPLPLRAQEGTAEPQESAAEPQQGAAEPQQGTAEPQESAAEPQQGAVTDADSPEGCEPRSRARTGEAAAWSCNDGTLWVAPVGAEPMRVASPAPAERVFTLDGSLWVRLRDGRTLSVGALLKGAASSRGSRPAPSVPPPPATPGQTTDAEAPPVTLPPRNPLRYGKAKLRGGQWTMAARPFIGDGTLGLALDASVTWRWTHAFLRFQLDPLVGSLATGADREGHVSFGTAALFGFDHRLFEIGLGVGLGLVRVRNRDAWDTFGYVRGIGLTVWQTARAGSIDAVHVVLRNAFTYLDRQIRHLAIDIKGVLPISQPTALVLRTFVSEPHGYSMGEVGMQIVLGRDADQVPTFLITPSVGFVAVEPPGGRSAAGGYVGFGAEWRTDVNLLEEEPQ